MKENSPLTPTLEEKMSCAQPESNVRQQERAAVLKMKAIPTKFLVMSGKGGVGKTTVSVNIAQAFSKLGFSVGIIDADIHGPNVALMCGLNNVRFTSSGETIEPLKSATGIKVLSIASFLPNESSPVAMRGPRKTAIIRQFVGETNWDDTDVLIVDCPPGTGDEPMSVAQLIPDADGVIVVTSPQEVSLLDSKKCIQFAQQMGLPITGVIENMSGYSCPQCGHRADIFKNGGGEALAGEKKVPFLGKIPITPELVIAGDSGVPIVDCLPIHPTTLTFCDIAKRIRKPKPLDDNELRTDI